MPRIVAPSTSPRRIDPTPGPGAYGAADKLGGRGPEFSIAGRHELRSRDDGPGLNLRRGGGLILKGLVPIRLVGTPPRCMASKWWLHRPPRACGRRGQAQARTTFRPETT